jgi:signal peptidase II
MPSFRGMLPWLGLAFAIVLADQWTKLVILSHFDRYERLPVLPFFDLILTFNRGAAFSLFADHDGWQRFFFIGVSSIASIVIVYLLSKHHQDRLFSIGLGLILGGAVGNLWDRIVLGHVVDFLLFYWRSWSFPAFNLADSAITLGAAVLIWHSLRSGKT